MTPAEYFRDNPGALKAWQLIEAARIPREASFNPFAQWPSEAVYKAAERAFETHNTYRRSVVRNVAAAIAREWPHPSTRMDLWLDLIKYCDGKPLLYQAITEVFDAAREEAAAMQKESNLQETN